MTTQAPPSKTTGKVGSLTTALSEKLKVAGAKAGRGDQKDLNIAILKATTSQFHVVPKEKHVRTLKLAVHPSRPRRDVLYIISELHKRLHSAEWLTVLKTLVTLHRLMRETEPSFMEELVRYSEGLAHHAGQGGPIGAAAALPPSRLFGAVDNFIDRTSSEGRFDFSEWVRAYGKYLDEQLSVYATLKWYVEQEAPGAESRMRRLSARDLLFQLPYLQRLQRRLLDCVPRGAATHDEVVLFSLTLVVKESFKVYKAVSEGIINLADAFFEMEYHDATRGLEFYKEGMASSDALSGYYATIEQIDEIKRSMQLPKLSTPPANFLTSMETYVAEAPRPVAAEGEAPAPVKKGVPLRKGKLLQSTSVRRADTGPSAAAAAGGPRDPGMVLPMPSGSAAAVPAASQESAGGEGATSPTGAAPADASTAQSAGQQADLLSDVGVEGAAAAGEQAAVPAAAAPPKPTALDLLSDLDFSFAPAAPADATGSAAGAASLSANPFADPVPLASAVAQAPAGAPVGGFSANPFGEPQPSPAAGAGSGGFGGSGGFEWPLQPQPPQQAYGQTQQAYAQPPAWGAAPLQQPQQQGFYGAPLQSPAGAGAHGGGSSSHLVVSDDPFATFGGPSPAADAMPSAFGGAGAAALRASGSGAFWSAPAAAPPYASGTPARPGTTGDELSKAALHDPFAALTGLPPKASPGGSAGKPSPPRFY